MIKLKIWCDSGANIHSCRKETVTVEELGYTDEEWNDLSEQDQEEAAKDVAFAQLDWGFVECNDDD